MMPETKIKFDKATAKWFSQNPNADTTVGRCNRCCLYFKLELGHDCEKSSKLEFSRKIGNIELRACPTTLARLHDDDPNETIDIVMWQKDSHGKPYCFSIAYWKRDDEGYELKFVGARPFLYVDDSRIPELWEAMKEAQNVLDAWFDEMEDD